MRIRKDTWDRNILGEVAGAYGWMDVQGKVVLDVGACFGAATQLFLDRGAHRVIAVEPEPNNVRLLCKNVGNDPRVTIIDAAVTSDGHPVDLYLAAHNTGAHSLYVSRGRGPGVRVRGIRWDNLLAMYRPSCIKIDCEGAEHEFLAPLPGYVRQVAMEIHLNKKAWRANVPDLLEPFDSWTCVRQPVITGKNWHTLAGYKR